MEEVEEGGKDKHFFHTETFQFLEEKWRPISPLRCTVLRLGDVRKEEREREGR